MSTEKLAKTAARNSAEKGKGIIGRLTNRLMKLEFRGTKVFIDGGFDVVYLILVITLLTIGLVMMFSASYINAKYRKNDPYAYITKQFIVAVVGVIAMFIISKINPEIFKKLTLPAAGVSIFLLILVLFVHTKVNDENTIKRWLPPIGPISIQPSDVGKLGLIMTLAYTLEKYKRKLEKIWWLPILFVAGIAFVSLLVFLESHLSGTILMLGIGILMLILGGLDKRWILFGFILGAVAFAAFWLLKDHILSPYQLQRISSFSQKDYTDIGARYQTNQSLFALGSGGIWGLGLGQSRQKFMYLPEPQNDFIFAIVGEELGFIRCVLILLTFAALIFWGFLIAEKKAKSSYERLLVLGINIQLALQIILNLLVVTDLMPNTGISLPFFSYGGTALLLQLVEMGMVLSVSRTGERHPEKKEKENKGDTNA